MSNFINPSVLAAEALDQLDYELVAGSLVYRDKTNEFANVRGLKVGDSVSIRTVTDFRTDEFTGTTIDSQEVQQSSTQLEIEKHFDVSVKITSRERALNLDGVRKEIINPAMTSMAQKIDEYLLSKVSESQGLFASGTLLADAASIAQASRAANLQQIGKGGRIALVDDELEATLLGTDVFHKFDTRGEPAVSALMEASMGRLMGIDWFSSVNFPSTTRTGGTGTAVLDNALATSNLQGSNTLVTLATVGTFEAGDKINIAGAKRDFTVATQTLAGATAIPLVEQINENLTGLGGAAITVVSTGAAYTQQGIIFNAGAYGFAAPPLDAAAGDRSGVASAAGLSVRVTEAYDIQTKETYWSFDMLVGAKAIDPRLSLLLADV
jgi:hypothetical protein